MKPKLYFHPFSSYCQKALIGLYEAQAAFEPVPVDLGDPASRAALAAIWPLAKFPVLRDEEAGLTLPEATIIVEYLAERAPHGRHLVPTDSAAALQSRLWDRFYDNYVETPLQKVVGDRLRPEGRRDPHGVEEAKAMLGEAYAIADAALGDGRAWAAGDAFTLADCAAAPALFYANAARPFAGYAHVEAYFERLLARPSFARAVDEARPYRHFFPLPWPDGY